ncbi:MAG TPA: zf-HC2 domain-containing protein [Pyrinomonadaceae bacterium]|nr:zf-HC2 domain-containing protein [Pyrinomonadaceae bacterium]
MLCEETRQSLSLYLDDCVSLPARVAIDEHLDRCPVCRSEVAELRLLRRRLSLLTPPKPPADLATTISNALAIEAAASRQEPKPSLGRRVLNFVEPWVMPYSAGSFASVIMFFLMFTALRPHFVALREAAAQQRSVIDGYDIYRPVTREGLAAERAPFSIVSPTLDPKGALASLTISYAHPSSNVDGEADDMIVVTDVFYNGAASLVDVVQPPRDKRMLDEFESALRQDAAFVPARLDRRPDTMRVVFAVQKVDVDDRKF